jgi:hypothetical protein
MTTLESFERIYNYVRQISGDKSLIYVQDPATGQTVAMREKTLYKAGFLTDVSGNSNQVLKSDDLPVNNVRNINGQKLANGKKFLVTGLRVIFDTTIDDEPLTDATLKTLAFASAAPNTFLNADVILEQGVELLNVPGRYISNPSIIPSNLGDLIFPIAPKVIRPETDFQIHFKFATAPAAKHAYRVDILGWELIDADKA